MKIILHSFSFWPQIGGVESVSHTLAKGWSAAGHQVTLVTETPCDTERETNYQVIRNPDKKQMVALVSASDLIHSNGASSRYFPLAAFNDKPFSWTHQSYQLQCIDGFGWVNGRPAPLEPAPSLGFHWHEFGARKALAGATRLWLRRLIGNAVSANVAISHHQAMLQPLPRQSVIYNPIEFDRFAVDSEDQAADELMAADATFTFVGRLITEKGVDDLLRSFAILWQAGSGLSEPAPMTLKIIGDGPQRKALQELATDLGIASQVKWRGAMSDDQLTVEIKKSGICVLPSAWQEPMGIIAVELMAAGKPLLVSSCGGLSECVQDAGLTFPNQDVAALAQAMRQMQQSKSLQLQLVSAALKRVKQFEPARSIDAYLDLFAAIAQAAHR